MHNAEELKAQARRLRTHLKSNNIALSTSMSLEAVAAIHGYRDWNTAVAAATKAATVTPHIYGLDDPYVQKLMGRLHTLIELAPDVATGTSFALGKALDEKKLPLEAAKVASIYLWELPGFRNGRYQDAEKIHQMMLNAPGTSQRHELLDESGELREAILANVTTTIPLRNDRDA
ncbi:MULTISPECIES: glyoxalase superfamily protein [Ectopseudomonas]|jgi:hypothetical protein|uniref:Uncharacterized protein n=2 Tax=Ectopseudomonas TaxID=3236654 RepID=A0A1G6Q109_9GAMM|nr:MULTISPECIES: glyoxalase superfamily protein [Pseudomonas]ALN21800.1 hypothetical protein DW68_024285 [Pseudomonas mendocina S5.2]MBP3062024.1 hypothetical protein [Pseudomonas chengduensis]NNB75317.1 hypothetical protein [Pseudomonas chengduensis]OEO24437.1 hypothetical protein AX279_17360 [Pseudomonas sp. J237]CRN67187.1 hypothetical protein PAERUG_P40_Scotland_4_VIM_2_09_12_04115 [Pseudomonas aeruginosa]